MMLGLYIKCRERNRSHDLSWAFYNPLVSLELVFTAITVLVCIMQNYNKKTYKIK